MKILAINGSHRGDRGYTQFLIDKLFIGAEKAGADSETIVLAKSKIKMCISCRLCQSVDHYLKCVFDETDDVKAIFKKIRSADIIVYASPIYIFTISSLLKTFIERFHSASDSSKHIISKSGLFFHHLDTALCSKPFAVILSQDNMEDETSKNAIAYFRTFSRFTDAPIVGTIIRKSAGAVGHGSDVQKEKQFPKLNIVYNAIEKAGYELGTYGMILRATQKKACMDVLNIPVFINFLLKSSQLKKVKGFTKKILEKSQG